MLGGNGSEQSRQGTRNRDSRQAVGKLNAQPVSNCHHQAAKR